MFAILVAILSVAACTKKSEPRTTHSSAAKNVAPVVTEVDERIEEAPPADLAAVRKLGTELVSSVADARTSLQNKDIDAARRDLGRASVALGKIELKRPSIDVAYTIWRAGSLEGAGMDKTPAPIAPLIRKIREVPETVVDPDQLAKLGDGDNKAPIELVDSAVLYSETDIPLAATKLDIASALGFIAENKLPEAMEVLADVSYVLTPQLFSTDAPIVVARNQLLAARAHAAVGDVIGARASLASAKTALAEVKADRDAPDSVKAALGSFEAELHRIDDGLSGGTNKTGSRFGRLLKSWAAIGSYVAASSTSMTAERADLAAAIVDIQMAEYFGNDSEVGAKALVAARKLLASMNTDELSKPLVDRARDDLVSLETAKGEKAEHLRASALYTLRDLYYRIRPRSS